MGVVSAIVASVALAATAYSVKEQRDAAKEASKDRKEAQAIGGAEQASQQREQTRAQMREERVRRAQILQASENTGVSGSSGALGSIGSMQTTIGSNLASASRQGLAAQGITAANQSAADAISRGQTRAATAGLFANAVSLGGGAFQAYNESNAPGAQPDYSTPGGMSPVEPRQSSNLFG